MAKLGFGRHHGPHALKPTLAGTLGPGRTTTALFSGCILATPLTGQKGRPVKPKDGGPMEALNPTEVERLMAAEGYTDHCNLSTPQRLMLLGESWHLQTIVELLRPLAEHV